MNNIIFVHFTKFYTKHTQDTIIIIIFFPTNFRFINAELAKHQVAASKRWDFDFVRGRPLISKSNTYIWERVPPTNAPEVYTLSRAAHAAAAAAATRVLTSSSSSSILVPSYNDLLDERSARSNQHSTLIEMDVSVTSSIINDHHQTNGCDERLTSLMEQIKPECSSTTSTSTKSSIQEKRQPKITGEFLF